MTKEPIRDEGLSPDTADSDAAHSPVIELREVTKDYGAVHVLDGINLRINQGEVTCVLGITVPANPR